MHIYTLLQLTARQHGMLCLKKLLLALIAVEACFIRRPGSTPKAWNQLTVEHVSLQHVHGGIVYTHVGIKLDRIDCSLQLPGATILKFAVYTREPLDRFQIPLIDRLTRQLTDKYA